MVATPVGDGGAAVAVEPFGANVTSMFGGTVSDFDIVPHRVERNVYDPGRSSVTTWPALFVRRLPTQLPVEP